MSGPRTIRKYLISSGWVIPPVHLGDFRSGFPLPRILISAADVCEIVTEIVITGRCRRSAAAAAVATATRAQVRFIRPSDLRLKPWGIKTAILVRY